ncbi:MAG: SpoIIE family protein phosphatase [Frankiaceae bacterium]|nr:SpoIIE family protein phosphatase [Frankiaceae bacterium]
MVQTLGELRLGSEPDAIPRARRFAVNALDDQPQAVIDDAALIVTELLTNAVLHGEPPVILRVRHLDDRVRIEVEDGGRKMPVTVRHSTEAMTGRGLPLVAALSAAWGVDALHDGGKAVWAELTAESAAALPTDTAPEVDLDAFLAAWPDEDDEGETRYTVRLGAVPTELLLAAKAHIDNVVREFTLARGGDEAHADAEMQARFSDLIETVTRGFVDARAEIKRQAVEAAGRGDVQTELVLTLPLSAADAGEKYLLALDEADAYARAARLLTLATPPAHRVFRQWYVQSLVDQLRAQARGEDAPLQRTFPQRLADEVQELATYRDAWDRLQLLQKVTADLTNARTVEEIAAVVVKSSRNLGAISARVYLLVGDMLESIAAQGADTALEERYPHVPVSADLPGGVVVRTGERLLLRNVAQILERFPALADVYAGTSDRTLHVAPLIVGDHTLGVLSLSFPGGGQLGEDSQADFVTSLADALAQALERATALEKARAANERLSFLAEASVALSGSLDYRETLSAVAQLLVPQLADWCVIQVLDGGELTNVGLAHFDPAKVAWAEQNSGRYPTDMDAPTGAPNVIRTGQSELYAEIPEELLEAAAVDEEHLELLRALGMSSALVVPLTGRLGTFGAITLIYAESGRRYAEGDIVFAEDVARRAALAVETADAFREQSGRLAEVTRIAETAQLAILAPPPKRIGPIALSARYVSAAAEARVGGDLYEVVERDGAIRLLIGDVRGKGLAAVRTATVVLGEFRGAAADLDDLVDVAAQIDRRLRPYLGDEDFVTALLADIRVDGSFSIASCGHPPALLASAGTVSEIETAPSLPLGLGAQPQLVTGQLSVGDRLLLYTDGAIEARDRNGAFAGVAPLIEPVRRGAVGLGDLLDAVLAALHDAAGAELGDDVALLVAEYCG